MVTNRWVLNHEPIYLKIVSTPVLVDHLCASIQEGHIILVWSVNLWQVGMPQSGSTCSWLNTAKHLLYSWCRHIVCLFPKRFLSISCCCNFPDLCNFSWCSESSSYGDSLLKFPLKSDRVKLELKQQFKRCHQLVGKLYRKYQIKRWMPILWFVSSNLPAQMLWSPHQISDLDLLRSSWRTGRKLLKKPKSSWT